MTRSHAWLAFCRTPRGQLSVIGAIYLGALIISGVVLALRPRLNETVRERFPAKLDELDVAALHQETLDIAEGRAAPKTLGQRNTQELHIIYGSMLNDDSIGMKNPLSRALWAEYGPEMITRVRKTLAVGSLAQRLRALEFLGIMSEPNLVDEAIELCQFAAQRSRRCGESEIVARAESLVLTFRESRLTLSRQ